MVVGLPDDQSLRPISTDISRLNEVLSDVTEAEVDAMSALSVEFASTAAEVAAAHGAPTVTTDDPVWTDPSTMNEDGIHPNTAGYQQLSTRWLQAVEPML